MGPFSVRANFPGQAMPGYNDHGYGPLALIGESFLKPGTLIRMHEHRNDEIISYVPEGVMRHDDRSVGPLIIDPDHLMVMNAGRSFWHEERTLHHDPPLRMLQIFVRPDRVDLEPRIQHGRLARPQPNVWRHLLGPEGNGAPFFVRNDIHCYDLGLDTGASTPIPLIQGWHAYLFVFSGAVEIAGARFTEAESCLLTNLEGIRIEAIERSSVVSFLINPDAAITHDGTVGR